MNELLNVERIKRCPKCGGGRISLFIEKYVLSDQYEYKVSCGTCCHSTGWCYPEWYVIQKWEENKNAKG